jgi:hypothetical protein
MDTAQTIVYNGTGKANCTGQFPPLKMRSTSDLSSFLYLFFLHGNRINFLGVRLN